MECRRALGDAAARTKAMQLQSRQIKIANEDFR